jgi:hypothetical protein
MIDSILVGIELFFIVGVIMVIITEATNE